MTRSLYGLLIIAFVALAGYGVWSWWQERTAAPTVLTIAAGPIGSDAYVLLREVAEVAARQSDRIRVRVRPSNGSSDNVSMLLADRARHAGAASPTEAAIAAYRRLEEAAGDSMAATWDFERADPPSARLVASAIESADLATIHADTPAAATIRLVAKLFTDYFLIIARADAGIRTIPDLVGKRLALPPAGSDELRAFFAIVDHYRLDPLQLRWSSMETRVAIDAMTQREVDAIFAVRSVRDVTIAKLVEDMALTRAGNLTLIPIEQAEAMALKRPYLKPVPIVKGAFEGAAPGLPPAITPTPGVERLLVARADVDEAAIQELTRILFETRLDLITRYPLAAEIAQPTSEAGLLLPLHAGAQAYYTRDEPSFFVENAEAIGVVFSIFGLTVSALFAMRSGLLSALKNRADSYNYDLLDIRKQALAAETLDELKACKAALSQVIERVVVALDKDEITEAGFQSFALVWESVRETINDRIAEVRRHGTP